MLRFRSFRFSRLMVACYQVSKDKEYPLNCIRRLSYKINYLGPLESNRALFQCSLLHLVTGRRCSPLANNLNFAISHRLFLAVTYTSQLYLQHQYPMHKSDLVSTEADNTPFDILNEMPWNTSYHFHKEHLGYLKRLWKSKGSSELIALTISIIT